MIFSELEKNKREMYITFADCFDFVGREFCLMDGTAAFLCSIDGISSGQTGAELVMYPLMGMSASEISDTSAITLKNRLINVTDVSATRDFPDVISGILSGDTAIFIDGQSTAIIAQTKGWAQRGIAPPDTERTIRGAKEGFCETILTNTAMIRRRIKSPKLKIINTKVGNISNTSVCMAYIEGIAEPALVEKMKNRLKNIDVDYILESGHIEQLIEDRQHTLFSTVSSSERPDVVAGKLMKGRVAVVTDGTPFVLTAPMLFSENFHSVEDYFSRRTYSIFIRVLRMLCYFISILLPSGFIALSTHHQEMIPAKLLGTIISSAEGAPLPLGVEMLIMLLLYEVLREAVLRLPNAVGATVGIVGSLVIGEAAAGAHLISQVTIVIAAITFITSAVVYNDSVTLVRIILLVASLMLGIFGTMLGIFIMTAHLCALNSFGTPYLLPVAPFSKKGITDSVYRDRINDVLRGGGL